MARVFGHFGELMQGRIGALGPVGLITLPCPVLWAEAALVPSSAFSLYQKLPIVPPAQLYRLLKSLKLNTSGRFRLNLTMLAGGGAGASTAALMALAKAAGATDTQSIIAAVLAEEGASDPLLFDAPERLLWASRQGKVLAHLPSLPRFDIIGGFWGPVQRTDPNDHDFPDISDLLSDWPGAGLSQMAQLTSQSALRTLALRGPQNDPTKALACDLGALGFTIAHTGTARGLIFAPGMVPKTAATALRVHGFSRITQFKCGG